MPQPPKPGCTLLCINRRYKWYDLSIKSPSFFMGLLLAAGFIAATQQVFTWVALINVPAGVNYIAANLKAAAPIVVNRDWLPDG